MTAKILSITRQMDANIDLAKMLSVQDTALIRTLERLASSIELSGELVPLELVEAIEICENRVLLAAAWIICIKAKAKNSQKELDLAVKLLTSVIDSERKDVESASRINSLYDKLMRLKNGNI